MKKVILLIVFTLMQIVVFAQTQQPDTGSSKAYFHAAFDSLKNMLEGKDSLSYEKAVFITENAYYDNAFSYADFERTIDLDTTFISRVAQEAKQENKEKVEKMGLYFKNMWNLNAVNSAIYKYMADTVYYYSDSILKYKTPFNYSNDDPYGSTDWQNTQVLHLLYGKEGRGNCYALTSLYKIFSDRLHADARLVTAPHHIYIQVKNLKGDYWNVELTSRTFPGDGSIQTLTYTTHDLIMNGMAQQPLTDKQAVVLNLIYLAKSYEHKFNDNTNDFLLQCADLAFQQDTLSLNALLLKAEVTENRLFAAMAERHGTKKLLADYEKQLNRLYQIGYVEVPKNIEEMILAAIEGKEKGAILTNHTPNPFAPIGQNQRYYTLSGGVFDELHEKTDTAEYFHALLNTKTKKIIGFMPVDTLYNNEVDPVVFALSVDPLASKLPSYSPYAAFNDNPILFDDPTGAYSELGAIWRNALHGGSGIYKTGKDWGYNTALRDASGKEIGFTAHFGTKTTSRFGSILADQYKNSEIGPNGQSTGKGALGGSDIIFNTIFTVGTLGIGGVVEGAASEIVGEAGSEAAADATAEIGSTSATQMEGETGNYSVYQGFDRATGEVKYVGITGRDPAVRFAEHAADIGTGRESLYYRTIGNTGTLSQLNARVVEQTMINQFGLVNNGQLLNKINSIAPKYWDLYNIPR